MRYLGSLNSTPVPVSRPRRIELVVLHSAEAPEKPGKAWDVALWFSGKQAPQASAHYVVDSGEVVQCVFEQDIAWAAPGANHNGIHVELVGYARQLAEDWADTYSVAMLKRAAQLVAGICERRDIPIRVANAADLKAGARGITTHAAVTEAFRKSTHTDPGPGFPMDRFVQRVAELVDSLVRR